MKFTLEGNLWGIPERILEGIIKAIKWRNLKRHPERPPKHLPEGIPGTTPRTILK